mmetsp:Transcript_43122/g.138669  ORF Transcript_43122/g.138669 Transcript_43122/m.138669 type:complete len:297 (+) Transcript_43122:398-1288(+)
MVARRRPPRPPSPPSARQRRQRRRDRRLGTPPRRDRRTAACRGGGGVHGGARRRARRRRWRRGPRQRRRRLAEQRRQAIALQSEQRLRQGRWPVRCDFTRGIDGHHLQVQAHLRLRLLRPRSRVVQRVPRRPLFGTVQTSARLWPNRPTFQRRARSLSGSVQHRAREGVRAGAVWAASLLELRSSRCRIHRRPAAAFVEQLRTEEHHLLGDRTHQLFQPAGSPVQVDELLLHPRGSPACAGDHRRAGAVFVCASRRLVRRGNLADSTWHHSSFGELNDGLSILQETAGLHARHDAA